jgi:hypothetical protein
MEILMKFLVLVLGLFFGGVAMFAGIFHLRGNGKPTPAKLPTVAPTHPWDMGGRQRRGTMAAGRTFTKDTPAEQLTLSRALQIASANREAARQHSEERKMRVKKGKRRCAG